MRVDEFHSAHQITDLDGLALLLSQKSADEVNNFILSDEASEFPQLWIMVNGCLAALEFFPAYGEPAFRSHENMLNDGNAHPVLFKMAEHDQDLEVDFEFWVTRSHAIEAAKEFFIDQRLPKCVKWLEL
ncbi:MAG: hypothetical protein K8T25_20590 [Planctomycetia bacterium]|nr:hypothetical protein [Planctomycetia bacterium]